MQLSYTHAQQLLVAVAGAISPQMPRVLDWLQHLTLLCLLRIGLRLSAGRSGEQGCAWLPLASPSLRGLPPLPAGPDFADWVCLGIGYVSLLGALAVAVWMGLSWAMLRGGRHRARLGAARGLLTASRELGRELHGKLVRSAGGLPPKLLSLAGMSLQHKRHAKHVAGWSHLRPTSSGTPLHHHTQGQAETQSSCRWPIHLLP